MLKKLETAGKESLSLEETIEFEIQEHKDRTKRDNAAIDKKIEMFIDNPILGLSIKPPFVQRPSNPSLFFIIPNEFAERFCYYGFHALLKNLIGKGLGITKYQYGTDGHLVQGSAITADTNSLKLNFDTFVYFFPLIGAAVSDSFLNKYWTVATFGLSYLIGLYLLFAASNPTIWGFSDVIHPILSAIPNSTEAAAVAFIPDPSDAGKTGMSFWPIFIALFLIALGTGGIKPCVSSHGGDQFLPQQTFGLNQFFSFFYIAINLGALISGLWIPRVQEGTCFGSKGDCYSIAFLYCAVVFTIAYVVFVAGKPLYRIVPPAGRFIIWDLAKAGCFSIFKGSKEAIKVYGKSIMTEVRDLAMVLIFILPTPIFWMGFNQNGSTWQDSTDRFTSRVVLNSTQVNAVINPFFIAVLAPIFSIYIFPTFPKFTLKWRMVVGYLFAAAAFVVCGLIDGYVLANCSVDLTLPKADDFYQICTVKNLDNMIFSIPIFLVTIAEVLVSISGLNFMYDEVGPRTKSSASALWLATSGVGSLLANVLQTNLSPGVKADAKHVVSYDHFYYICAGVLVGGGIVQYLLAVWYVPKKDRPVV